MAFWPGCKSSLLSPLPLQWAATAGPAFESKYLMKLIPCFEAPAAPLWRWGSPWVSQGALPASFGPPTRATTPSTPGVSSLCLVSCCLPSSPLPVPCLPFLQRSAAQHPLCGEAGVSWLSAALAAKAASWGRSLTQDNNGHLHYKHFQRSAQPPLPLLSIASPREKKHCHNPTVRSTEADFSKVSHQWRGQEIGF